AKSEVARRERLKPLEGRILHRAEHHSSGMFLWVKLLLENLNETIIPAHRRQKLEEIPTGLFEAFKYYDERLRRFRVNPEQQTLREQAFRIVLGAKRPLSIKELYAALQIMVLKQAQEDEAGEEEEGYQRTIV